MSDNTDEHFYTAWLAEMDEHPDWYEFFYCADIADIRANPRKYFDRKHHGVSDVVQRAAQATQSPSKPISNKSNVTPAKATKAPKSGVSRSPGGVLNVKPADKTTYVQESFL